METATQPSNTQTPAVSAHVDAPAHMLIRNNTARLWTLADKTIQPNQAAQFTEAELRPFMGSKALEHAFKVKDLEFLSDPRAPLAPETSGQVSKPAPQIGEQVPVNAADPQRMAELLQSGVDPIVNVNERK